MPAISPPRTPSRSSWPTVQVVLDRPRLRLGTHRLTVGLTVEGFGEVSVDTTDEVVEGDLLDVDPADYGADDVLALAEAVREPVTLERLRDRERDGPGREAVLDGLLVDVLESPQRVSVSFAARTLRGRAPAEIADVTLLSTDTVAETLEDFEREGIADSDGDVYEVAPPVTVLRQRSNEVWTLLRKGLQGL